MGIDGKIKNKWQTLQKNKMMMFKFGVLWVEVRNKKYTVVLQCSTSWPSPKPHTTLGGA